MLPKNMRNHIVKPGETLSAIARVYGLGWKEIYYHDANAHFRAQRPNPGSIAPGDRITIPPDPVKILGERLTMLRELEAETTRQFDDIARSLDADYAAVKSQAATIDAVGTVATVVANLASLSASALKALQKTGPALAEANRLLARTHFTNTAGTMASVAGSGLEPRGDEGLGWALGKILLKSWSDMTSPSWWAGRLGGAHPDDDYRTAGEQVRHARAKTLEGLYARMRETESMLQQARMERSQPGPGR